MRILGLTLSLFQAQLLRITILLNAVHVVLPAQAFADPCSCSSLSETYTIEVQNEIFSLDETYIIFYPGSGFDCTPLLGATEIQLNTSYPLSSSQNQITCMPTNWAGNLYLSDAPLTASRPNPTDTSDQTRYQPIEFAGTTSQAAVDITYINWYSLPLELASTTSQSSQTRGLPISGADVGELSEQLANLSIQEPTNTTVVRNGINQIVRVIGPSNGPGPDGSVSDKYPSFSDYIDATFPSASSVTSINIDNVFSGNGLSGTLNQRQRYQVTDIRFDAQAGMLTLTGNTTEDCGFQFCDDVISTFTMTSMVSSEEFSDAIYRAVLDYTYTYTASGGASESGSGNTGSNDVFATVSRDLLAGFSFGFIGSAIEGGQTSAQWQTATEYFSELQPDHPDYNVWGNVLAGYFQDVYTFPFSDFISNTVFTPTIQVATDHQLTITVPEPTNLLQGVAALGTLVALSRRRRTATTRRMS